MTGRILVVGDVITDIVVVPQGPVARGTDTPATIRQMPGGSGANQAVWLAAMGADAHFAARVGAGDVVRLTRHFEGQGVAAHLSGDEANPTGTLICLVDTDGERSFLTDRGANAHLGETDLPFDLLDGMDRLHVSGYALFEPKPRAAVMALAARARAANIPVSIDPASTGFLAEAGYDNFLGWAADAEIIFPNADEAELLTGRTDPAHQIAALLDIFPRVVLKRGREGAIYAARGGETLAMPAQAVEMVDTTGAGDAFLAGFLAADLRGEAPAAAMSAAIAAGARAVSRLGAQPLAL
ncbi:carbohydrate kinase family protein [Pelagibacterium halotolerans]|uniref:Ribokinase n=1 Tax=Pelagibacterium halotolerans (strain DSM 22347 / JCM 15775 / CGMCC 1.7692 / B2) TaxID=1082931 RepID=G4R5Y8_PELHB|nr:PfkB family carbohydrate kinase [Pelagibacterium halotolerans]AEQ51103.1 ribokinase [Pelagibacterium halotolerans B2]SEA70644.1 Sugar or nucleoside kinase, ribokinase family [Pelagibacterium halotolerans]